MHHPKSLQSALSINPIIPFEHLQLHLSPVSPYQTFVRKHRTSLFAPSLAHFFLLGPNFKTAGDKRMRELFKHVPLASLAQVFASDQVVNLVRCCLLKVPMSRSPSRSGVRAETVDADCQNLFDLFVGCGVEEDDTIMWVACQQLVAANITKEWKLVHAPEEAIHRALPVDTHADHLTATHYWKKLLAQQQSKKERADDPMVRAMAKVAQETKNASKKALKRKRDDDSSSSDADDASKKHFEVEAALKKYGFAGFSAEHMQKSKRMAEVAKEAEVAKGKRKDYLAPRPLLE